MTFSTGRSQITCSRLVQCVLTVCIHCVDSCAADLKPSNTTRWYLGPLHTLKQERQRRWVVSADRIHIEHILSMRSVTNGKCQSCLLAFLGWWGWLWINSTASGWQHKGAKCYVTLCYTECLLCALIKVITTWPTSHIKRIKSVLMLNVLTSLPMYNSAGNFSNASY